MSDRSEAYRVSDDLVERVVRAICETENGPCKCMPDECGCTYWKAHARAAIALALEEAAKVADGVGQQPPTDNLMHDTGWDGASLVIAAAIRALKEEK